MPDFGVSSQLILKKAFSAEGNAELTRIFKVKLLQA